jgi:membrane protease YdiL (CAAX protease family)
MDLVRKEDRMTTIQAFIQRHPVRIFYGVVFAISWGSFLLVGGSGLFAGTSWQADPLFLLAVMAMLAGPPVAGLLLTGLVYGRTGFRDLLSRLVKWRLDARWYAVALLTAPFLVTSTLFALSRTSPVFLPSVLTTVDKVSLILSGIAVGIMGGFVEELGWTGFAIPRLRRRYGIFPTGLIVGVLWGVWHLLQMWWVGRTSTGALPPAFFLSLYVFTAIAQLTAYRVLMVWVYDGTGSLLVAILMHASYIFSTLFVLAPPTTGVPFLTYSGIFALVLWVAVVVVAVAKGGQLSRQGKPPGAPIKADGALLG